MNWTWYGFSSNYDAIILHCIALHSIAHIIHRRSMSNCVPKIRCIFYLHLIAIHNKFSNLAQTFELHVIVGMSHALQNCRTCSAPSTSLLVVDFFFKFFLPSFASSISFHTSILIHFHFIFHQCLPLHNSIVVDFFVCVQFPLNAIQFTRQDLTLNWTSDNTESVRFICYRYFFLFAKWKTTQHGAIACCGRTFSCRDLR